MSRTYEPASASRWLQVLFLGALHAVQGRMLSHAGHTTPDGHHHTVKVTLHYPDSSVSYDVRYTFPPASAPSPEYGAEAPAPMHESPDDYSDDHSTGGNMHDWGENDNLDYFGDYIVPPDDALKPSSSPPAAVGGDIVASTLPPQPAVVAGVQLQSLEHVVPTEDDSSPTGAAAAASVTLPATAETPAPAYNPGHMHGSEENPNIDYFGDYIDPPGDHGEAPAAGFAAAAAVAGGGESMDDYGEAPAPGGWMMGMPMPAPVVGGVAAFVTEPEGMYGDGGMYEGVGYGSDEEDVADDVYDIPSPYEGFDGVLEGSGEGSLYATPSPNEGADGGI